MDIIKFLMDHPGEEYTAADLESLVRGHVVTISPAASILSNAERAELAAQRKRLTQWRDDMADGHEDLPKVQHAIAELDRQMRGGWSDEFDAARKRVAKAVSIAINAIAAHLPEMASDLRSAVTSGALCIYLPR